MHLAGMANDGTGIIVIVWRGKKKKKEIAFALVKNLSAGKI